MQNSAPTHQLPSSAQPMVAKSLEWCSECECVPAQEVQWEELVEKHAESIVRGQMGTNCSGKPLFQLSISLLNLSFSTLGRFVLIWIFGNFFRALSVKYMHILKRCYFNLDVNKEEMMYATVIIISHFIKPIAFKKNKTQGQQHKLLLVVHKLGELK